MVMKIYVWKKIERGAPGGAVIVAESEQRARVAYEEFWEPEGKMEHYIAADEVPEEYRVEKERVILAATE